jgi:hypothetical protein
MKAPALRQTLDAAPVSGNQRFLLGARPTFYLPLGRNGIGDYLKVLSEYQSDRPA